MSAERVPVLYGAPVAGRTAPGSLIGKATPAEPRETKLR